MNMKMLSSIYRAKRSVVWGMTEVAFNTLSGGKLCQIAFFTILFIKQ